MTKIEEMALAARNLAPVEQLRLIETLMEQLEPLDPAVMQNWAAEADERYAAYARGEVPAADWESIKSQLGQ